ncbi:MAG TPA: exodeoxyribonuclease VII large subunit, partial [Byssovorax sp.]
MQSTRGPLTATPTDGEPRREVQPLGVGELDRRVRSAVEGLGRVLVSGEVGAARDASSGHLYFTLKDEDEDASIDCVVYRTALSLRARELLVDGARVVVGGRATVYASRGRLQFAVDAARPLGRGALLEALERLRDKLAAEGLFAREKKRALPAHPRVVGVVTSGDGAAIHDIVKVAFRRAAVRIVLARAPVQGPNAALRIGRALSALARHPEVEVIVLARGGGSSDDLAVFHDEALVRLVASCRVPTVSAIGHETDTT